MKKHLAFTLTLVLLLSLCAIGYAAPLIASAEDAEAQINVIFQNFTSCKQDETDGPWYYAVTDLDHNGRLELLASSFQMSNQLPAVKAWELNTDGSALQPCELNLSEGDVFPNILTDSAETRYDKEKDAWFYLVSVFYPASVDETCVEKSAVALNSGVLGCTALAYEHVSGSGSSFTDTENNAITAEAFNAIGDEIFKDSQKSSTYFEWFTASAASQLSTFADSYAVFTDEKTPSQTFPVSVPFPAGFLAVTKNPISERHAPGENATFVADAYAYTSPQWFFVSPEGAKFNADEFAMQFPKSALSGTDSTALSIWNLPADMDGWSVCCMFSTDSRTVWTNQARICVQDK